MKKSKPEIKLSSLEQKAVSERIARRQRRYRCEAWGISPNPSLKILPTPEQLTTLAVALRKEADADQHQLCAKALGLWAAAIDVLDAQSKCAADSEAEFEDFKCAKMPDAKQFPMHFEKFLQCAFPELTVAERHKLFLAYLHDERTDEWFARGQGPIDQMPDDWYQNVRNEYEWRIQEKEDHEGNPNYYATASNFKERFTSIRRWYYMAHLPRERQKSGSLGGKKNRKISANNS